MQFESTRSRARCSACARSPGTDVGRGEPSPGADVGGESPLVVQGETRGRARCCALRAQSQIACCAATRDGCAALPAALRCLEEVRPPQVLEQVHKHARDDARDDLHAALVVPPPPSRPSDPSATRGRPAPSCRRVRRGRCAAAFGPAKPAKPARVGSCQWPRCGGPGGGGGGRSRRRLARLFVPEHLVLRQRDGQVGAPIGPARRHLRAAAAAAAAAAADK
jgi:hypothetical protein